jgi:hypothetical protein
MRQSVDTKEILLNGRLKLAPSVPDDLVFEIYEIEEKLQFDEERKGVSIEIRNAVKRQLDREYLEDTEG